MVFENGIKNIQAAAYNGARTVYSTGGAGSVMEEKLSELKYSQ